jgi:hypothetical protein
MEGNLSRLVRERAAGRCEYCHLPQIATSIPFEIDHVIARKHGGPTSAENLALACWYCNSAKGPNLSGVAPETGRITRLFHPRRHRWPHHFDWSGPILLGRTAIGRATVRVLEINRDEAVILRQSLREEGLIS